MVLCGELIPLLFFKSDWLHKKANKLIKFPVLAEGLFSVVDGSYF